MSTDLFVLYQTPQKPRASARPRDNWVRVNDETPVGYDRPVYRLGEEVKVVICEGDVFVSVMRGKYDQQSTAGIADAQTGRRKQFNGATPPLPPATSASSTALSAPRPQHIPLGAPVSSARTAKSHFTG